VTREVTGGPGPTWRQMTFMFWVFLPIKYINGFTLVIEKKFTYMLIDI